MKKRLISALNSIPKERLIGALSTIPLIAASTMSGACGASCPYGLVNDPYPGQCSRFIDLNGDGLCDFSQVAATGQVDQTTQTTPNSNTQSTSSTQGDDDEYTIDTGNMDDQGSGNVSTINDPNSPGFNGDHTALDSTNYHVLPFSILLLAGYFFTHYLFQRGILKPKQHKKIWNILVTMGYLGTGVTGMLLTLIVNLGIRTAHNQGITFWHAELAILMVVGTLIHIHIYRKPFKRMFKVMFGLNLSKRISSVKSLASSK